ncbi:egf-like domain-containing protein [Holotrichia oblita]|uniref:Egf-like domain-containing protein n=1 Tax=Holotrichia oblita TaxID=644536 RepID=A0ACB9T9U5_HOLOL|nr:egf-like domain-containing protein [Holotrichia oblita]
MYVFSCVIMEGAVIINLSVKIQSRKYLVIHRSSHTKEARGWKSSSIAEIDVADFIANKKAIANKVLYDNQGTNYTQASLAMILSNETTELSVADKVGDNNIELSRNINKYPNFVTNVTNCTNCNITININ